MSISYYGSKLSRNKILTDEGYLICKNVPIGRIGWMDYFGYELPQEFNLDGSKKYRVLRTAEELFSEQTMSSFEGKPVTNTHPSDNLTVETAPMISRGHAQNIRRDGEYLVADLFIMDTGLIGEVQEKLKREVSSGYDCSWHDIGNGKFEQKDIIGNHIAVLTKGRAGPRVSIQDQSPEKEGGVSMPKMPISKRFLMALGLKQFVQDAEPEQIAEAMDEMKKEDVPEKQMDEKPAEQPAVAPVEATGTDKGEQLIEMINKVLDRIEKLEQREEQQQKSTPAETVLDEAEKSFSEKAEGEKTPEEKNEKAFVEDESSKNAEEDPVKEAEEDLEASEEKKPFPAQDSAVRNFIKDMKPIIMAIPDEDLRLKGAERLSSFVKDSFPRGNGENGYGKIAKTVSDNKRSRAADAEMEQQNNMTTLSEQAAAKWNARSAEMKGGNK